ncbi:cytochrome c550 [Viridibacillus sp. FSL R5-0477]|uniref:Membrane-attached cytochrome c550 n=1 Tax=Viridibacillus arenosi FSL R5-213 TaxID=1227360 RepID=W4ENY6_9BACL|nr:MULTISPECIES: cytochrome c [Viridibacillus]ETT82318.1 membrane-attached cytochrome c550 [Viridibacillus arenosi FSL R5-213]OMC85301.1 cytochrome C [Viridibacillus sp. FSL H8-0123]OMC87420.1 cytochrome C [Viridibacillus sp. FSL H7-0596]OMC92581.1 cytochrome C [Viridibacillus arenosi]QOV12722.1 cytochrome c [Viridibacillus sp. JNUCC-6]
MKKNPIIPYILIMAFGIGLIFFMSLDGADKKEEIAKGDETKTEESAKGEEAAGEFDPEAFAASKCISCHGENLEGSMGPNLHGTGLSADEAKDILQNGKGGMPGGLVPADNLDAMAKYIADLK